MKKFIVGLIPLILFIAGLAISLNDSFFCFLASMFLLILSVILFVLNLIHDVYKKFEEFLGKILYG